MTQMMPMMPIKKRPDDDDEGWAGNDTNHGFGGGLDLDLDEDK
jgi:hypothetical protein